MKGRILSALRSEPGQFVSGEQLAQGLGLSRAAVWKHIAALRQAGYDIEASPRRGYRLIAGPDLQAADLESALSGRGLPLPYKVHVHARLGSTNVEAARLAQAGAPEGTVVIADAQTAGRGRLGRTWHSPPGTGLWLSVVLRPPLPPAACSGITLTAGVAVAAAIEQVTGLQPGIKWPNDLLIGDRKVCGILTEIAAEWDKVHHLILGIGINVNQTEADVPADLRGSAGSLRLARGERVSRRALCIAVLDELARRYPAFEQHGFAAARDEWLRRSITIGRPVVARSAGGAVSGIAEDVDDDGALIVREASGAGVRVTSGEVTLRPADGHEPRPGSGSGAAAAGPEQED